MKQTLVKISLIALLLCCFTSCNVVKRVEDHQHLLTEVNVNVNGKKTSKEEIPNSDELAAQNRAAGQTQGRPQITETIVREKPKIGRNERVTIKNVMSGESKTVKFKQAEPLIDKGEWVLIDD